MFSVDYLNIQTLKSLDLNYIFEFLEVWLEGTRTASRRMGVAVEDKESTKAATRKGLIGTTKSR